jgi:hypothetical protein
VSKIVGVRVPPSALPQKTALKSTISSIRLLLTSGEGIAVALLASRAKGNAAPRMCDVIKKEIPNRLIF